jgi:predicted lipoprotein with Yx(FWY)xxD motif
VRLTQIVLPALAVALVAPAGTVAAVGAIAAVKAPAIKLRDNTFGDILARRDHQALYYWAVEKRAGGKVRCTGECAKAWPPLTLASAKAVPRRVAGIKGVFGVIRRPGGKLQLTYNRLPVYTYAHERPNQVLCDNVDGWFVVRL